MPATTFVNKTHEVYQHIVDNPGIHERDLVKSLRHLSTGAVMAAVGQLSEKGHVHKVPTGQMNSRDREMFTFEVDEDKPYVPSHSGRFAKGAKGSRQRGGGESAEPVEVAVPDVQVRDNTSLHEPDKGAINGTAATQSNPKKETEVDLNSIPSRQTPMAVSPIPRNGERSMATLNIELDGREVRMPVSQAAQLYKELDLIFGKR